MPAKKGKKTDAGVFDSIRKPMPPASKRMGEEKPESKAHPAARKVKHKKRVDNDGDI